jgi:hypothetical protein
MECAALKALRQEATGVFIELTLRRRRAQEYAAANAGEAGLAAVVVRPSDFEVYLQRRLSKSAARIVAHVATHGCQA